MKSSRPTTMPIHRARRAERKTTMQQDKSDIIAMLERIEHGTIMRMIREIVRWLTDHQNDLI